MKIPLIVKPIIDRTSQEQMMEIWSNGRMITIDAPFNPYFYSLYSLKLDFLKPQMENEVVNKILFSTMNSQDIYKYSFKNTRLLSQYREDDSIESDILFTDRILIDRPDLFTKYPNDNPLKVLFFDIECDTTGMFPIPERNAIIAIGCKCDDKKAIYMAETYDNDKVILNKFFDFIKETDPDIIVHYNGDSFDIPYCIERMKINHIPLNRWSRNNSNIHQFKNTINIGGRLSFDLYKEAQHDQTIFGIKNLKMKTLAKWIDKDKKLDVKEVEYSEMRKMVNTPKLREYLISDIEITEFLFKVYYKNVQMLAEMNNIPLNLMMGASASFLPTIIHGRKFQKLNIVSDKNNDERHPVYIKKKQGALTNTYNPGIYLDGIYKVDFASQYPNICRTFNISPETVRIIRYDSFTSNYNFDISNPKKYICSIPDEVANKNIIIEIDMEKRGFLSQFMDDVLTERFAIKKRMKEIKKDSSEYEYLHIRQNALKVIANIQTGYEGLEFARFGDLGCYSLITAMGRYYIKLAMKNISNVISVDTDGIFTNSKINIEELNKYLDDKTEELFKLKNYLHMDIELHQKAFFRTTKGKHYVLQDNDILKFHGQSFKGSHMPRFFDECLEIIARDMFDGKSNRNIDIKSFPMESLIQSIKVKDEGNYKGSNSLSMQLINAAKREMPGVKLKDNDQLSYIKTVKGYELIVPGKQYGAIDYKYYQSILDKIYERLAIEDTKQMHF